MYRILAFLTVICTAVGPAAYAQAPAARRPAAARAAGGERPAVPAPAGAFLPSARPTVLPTIQGSALTATNGILPDTVVRLRDARSGRIVDVQTTDQAGIFLFRGLDPGTYVVEIIGANQTVLAAGPILSIGAGELVSTVVKLPFREAPFGGLLGHTAASAAVISAAAAASGVLATSVTGQEESPTNPVRQRN